MVSGRELYIIIYMMIQTDLKAGDWARQLYRESGGTAAGSGASAASRISYRRSKIHCQELSAYYQLGFAPSYPERKVKYVLGRVAG